MKFEEYRQHDATALAALLRKRALAPSELLDVAQARADDVDERLNAITVDDDDFARARLAKPLTGPLAGVPFLLKDLYGYLEGTVFTNGSRLIGDFVAPATSTFIGRCLDAGLVPFGKTTSPEFGVNVMSSPVRFGPCRNPWNQAYSPGGSSGGAAAAVAAGIVPMAHATDGGGSIRIPASVCGLVGLKPSRGRTPVGPVVGEAWNGMAGGHVVSRSVRDTALMLDLIGGPEPGDPYACPTPDRPFLELMSVEPPPLRIGLMTTSPYEEPIDPTCIEAALHAARLLESLGHTIVEAEPELNGAAIFEGQIALICANQANDLDFWTTMAGRPLNSDYVENMTLAIAERGRQITGQQFARAIAGNHLVARSFGRFFGQHDLLLTPTLGTPPLRIGACNQNGDDLDAFLIETRRHIPLTPLYNMSGCPAISLPLFWDQGGLPIGVMLGAALGREDRLLQVAHQLEQAAPWFERLAPEPH